MTEYELLEKGVFIPTKFDDSILVNLRIGNKVLLFANECPLIINLGEHQIGCKRLINTQIFLFPKKWLSIFYWDDLWGLCADDINVINSIITLESIYINNGKLIIYIND